MKYLRAVLNESLRLYPVVPENSRQVEVDTTLPVGGGEDGKSPVFVKKGNGVHWSLYAMHRRKDLYGEDAESFVPERWLDQGEEKKGLRVGWEYLPFNGGPRICIGRMLYPFPFLPYLPSPMSPKLHLINQTQIQYQSIPMYFVFEDTDNASQNRTIRPNGNILPDRPPHAGVPEDRKPRLGTLAREIDIDMHRARWVQSRPVSQRGMRGVVGNSRSLIPDICICMHS